MSGGSLEKLTRAVTYWRYICFLRFRGFISGCSGFSWGCSWFSWGCAGFSWECSGFLGGVPGFSGVPECSVMFRCSVFRCSWKYYMPPGPGATLLGWPKSIYYILISIANGKGSHFLGVRFGL